MRAEPRKWFADRRIYPAGCGRCDAINIAIVCFNRADPIRSDSIRSALLRPGSVRVLLVAAKSDKNNHRSHISFAH